MNSKNKGFVKLDHDLVRGPEWRGLSGDAAKVLIDILDQFNGRNNGSIHYGVRHAMRCLNCSKRTAIRRLGELRASGLIVATEMGSFIHKTGSRKGITTAWRLTFLALTPTNRRPRQ